MEDDEDDFYGGAKQESAEQPDSAQDPSFKDEPMEVTEAGEGDAAAADDDDDDDDDDDVQFTLDKPADAEAKAAR